MPESKIDTWNQALSRIGVTKFVLSATETSIAATVCNLHWERIIREVLESHRWEFATLEAPLSRIDTQDITYDGNSDLDTDGVETKFPITFAFETASLVVTLDGITQTITTHYTVTDNQLDAGSSFITMVTAPPAASVLVITMEFSREGWEFLYSLPADCIKPEALLWDGVRYNLTPYENRISWAVLTMPDKQTQMLACDQRAVDAIIEYTAYLDYVPRWPALFHDCVIWKLAAELATSLKKSPPERQRCLDGFIYSRGQARAADANKKQTRQPQTPSMQARGVGDFRSDWPPYKRPT